MEKWDQLLSDGIGRCHNALNNLVIGVIDDKCLSPLILSTSIIMKGETSEHQVGPVVSTISFFLQRRTEVLEHSHPSYQNNIPDPISMNIGRLRKGGALTSDTCNGARKACCLIVEKFHEATEAFLNEECDDIYVLEVDCWNHLRNIWLGVTTKALSILFGKTIREE